MKYRAGIVLAAAMTVSACGINSVPTAEENVNARWADVQADYQRRANLIPNLVNTVKASVAAEDMVLTDVVNARARATAIQVNAEDLSDPAKMQQFAAAQGQLGGTLSRLLATVEAYPEVKSTTNFTTLMRQKRKSRG